MNDGFSRFIASIVVAIIAGLFLAVALPFAVPMAQAQDKGCVPVTLKTFSAISVKLGLVPQWSGMSPNGQMRYVILANPQNQNWTAAVVWVGKDMACVLTEGKSSEPVFGEPT
jgi:hypothetical protein